MVESGRTFLSFCPDGNAKLFGYDKATDSKTAALINGFNAHSLELDDGHRFAMIHLGAVIISAIEAASDDNIINKDNYLKGIIMGYEAACRLSISIQPSHKKKGYHTSGTCGTIGAAIGVACALNMNKNQMKRVISAAAGSAAGLLELQEQKSELKPFNIGRAAMDGLVSAYMGFAEYESPDDVLGGERGFATIFSDDFSIENLFFETDYFEIERIYVKPYASCRHSHSAVEAAIAISKRVNADDIQSVFVETYGLGVKGHSHKFIQGVASAKLSTPYAVAAALIFGRADITLFEPLDENIVRFSQKVEVVEDKLLSSECPQKRIAVVTVTLKDGKTITERVDYAKGEPENPISTEELNEKIRVLDDYSVTE